MPSFDEVRGVQPEYDNILVRMLEVRMKGGETADFVLEEGDQWQIDAGQLVVTVQLAKNNESVTFNYNHVVYISCRDAIVKRPKGMFKPQGV